MNTKARTYLAGLFCLILMGGNLSSAPAPATTTITVPDLHCNGCAKRVAAQLQQISGVDGVAANVEAKTMTVMPKPQMTLSPKALWEAVEKAKKNPTKLEGPTGTFTEKPKS